MSVSDTSWRDRYQAFIEQVVNSTLQGKIRSSEQVYKMLTQNLTPGTGEIFERCLSEQLTNTKQRLDSQSDELRKAKATRQLRALQTLQEVWDKWQKENLATQICSQAVAKILAASPSDHFAILLEILDPNQPHPFTSKLIQQLAQSLQKSANSSTDSHLSTQLQQLSAGLSQGLNSFANLEDNLISWMYDQNRQIGFENDPQQLTPWKLWAQLVKSPLPQQLFNLQTLNQPIAELVKSQQVIDLSAWVELAIILRGLQQGLVTWFDQQPYNTKWGKRLACGTLLTFGLIWNELSNGFNQANRSDFAKACFQMTLQSLRIFTQRDDFPLYGGIFASFSGQSLGDTLNYLDEPLRQVENTQEKGRILTLLGYSQRILGQYNKAKAFHQDALEIARMGDDYRCAIANLNHLSRLNIDQKQYEQAINESQRALILARQKGDRLGEANALTNLGYSEVLLAKKQEQIDPEIYQASIERLQQALKLSERIETAIGADFIRLQTQALCYNSLGIAYVIIEQPRSAIEYLEKGIKSAQMIGDFYLQGINFIYLAQAYYSFGNLEKTIYNGCLGMYLLEQINNEEWRKIAALLSVLQGQIGLTNFQEILRQQRSQIIPIIGVDGFDYIPNLLEKYRQSL